MTRITQIDSSKSEATHIHMDNGMDAFVTKRETSGDATVDLTFINEERLVMKIKLHPNNAHNIGGVLLKYAEEIHKAVLADMERDL